MRAFTGGAVALAGVLLGIGTLLWATEGSDDGASPAVEASTDLSLDEPALPDPFAAPTEVETPPEDFVPDPDPLPVAPPVVEPPPPAAAQPTTQPAVQPVPVLVLNNSRISGLAARSAERFEAGGWPVRDVGDLRGRIRATTIYYPPGQEAAARAFAERFPEIQRVLPRLENLPGEGLTVVVTRDVVD